LSDEIGTRQEDGANPNSPQTESHTPREVYIVRDILRELPVDIFASRDERRDTSARRYDVPHFEREGNVSMRRFVDTTFTSMRYTGIRRIMGVECHTLVTTKVTRDYVADSASGVLEPRSESLSFEEVYLRKSDRLPIRLVSTSTEKGKNADGSAMRTEVTLAREQAPGSDADRLLTDPKSID
jgi:hypothetical protein